MPKQDDLATRSLGRSSPRDRGSRRSSKDVNWEYDSGPESDTYRKSSVRDRPSRKMSIRDRNFFTDALDDLEVSIRKFEEESGVLLHDFVSIYFSCILFPPVEEGRATTKVFSFTLSVNRFTNNLSTSCLFASHSSFF